MNQKINILFLIAVLFVAFSQCSYLKSTAMTELKLKLSQIKQNSDLGNAIINLAELNEKLDAGRYDPLFDALDELKQFLENLNTSEVEAYKLYLSNSAKQMEQHTTNLSNANKKLGEQNTKLDSLKNQKSAAEGKSKAAQLIVDSNVDERKRLVDTRASELKSFTKRQGELTELIAAINAALGHLNTLKNDSSNTNSFIQVEFRRNYEQATTVLAQQFAKEAKNGMYSTIIDIMTQISSEQNYVNQDGLANVIALLEGMKTDFETEQSNAIKAEADAVKLHGENVKKVDGIIEAQKKIVEIQDKLASSLGSQIKDLAAQIVTTEANIKGFQGQIDDLKVQDGKREKQNLALIAEIKRELAILADCYTVLNKAGIARSSN